MRAYDANEYAALFSKNFDLVCYIIKQVGVKGDDVDEVAADTFEKFCLAWQKTLIDNPRGYLMQVARTVAIDAIKKKKTKPHGYSVELHDVHETEPDVEGSIVNVIQNKYVRAAISSFEKLEGHAFLTMRYIEERSVAEICAFHSWPLGSYGWQEKKIIAAFRTYFTSFCKNSS